MEKNLKETICVNFVGFWPNYMKDDNYFYNLLSTSYKVVIDEDSPDIVFYSVDYTRQNEIDKYLGTKAKIVYYTGENTLPDWDKVDLAFTFSYDDHGGKNYRLPLWVMYINWFDRPYNGNRDQAYLHNPDLMFTQPKDVNKKQFCNFLYTNMKGRRMTIFPHLDSAFPNRIVSAGSAFNNTGYKIPGRSDTIDKFNFIDQFKFTISFENTSSIGYQTEKIFHPMAVNSIPIYWGNPKPETDFNTESFVFANNLTDEEVCDKIRTIDEDEELYRHILSQPWFVGNDFPDYVKPKNVLRRLEEII
jgi:alpha(1,3/1,4) fucosyltransferase